MITDTNVKVAIVLFLSIGYAIVRYHFFGPVEAANIPSYLVNKGSSLAAVFFLLFSAHARYQKNNPMAQYWGKVSLVLMGLHVFLSWSLWSPGYFEFMFANEDWTGLNDKMNFKGELVLLTGAVGSVVYLMISSRRPKAITLLMTVAAAMVCMHVGVMGVRGWFNPTGWNGGLPPITLLSFLGAAACFWYLLTDKVTKK